MRFIRTRDPHEEYLEATRQVKVAMRSNRPRHARDWLHVAEQCMRVQNRFDVMVDADAKRKAMRAERPHRLKLLAERARFAR